MKILLIVSIILLFCVLTLLTQVGGIVLLLSFLTHRFIDARTASKGWRTVWKFSCFIVFYFLVGLLILPLLAKPFNRAPLPVFSQAYVKPLRAITWICNRHYVRKDMIRVVNEAAAGMQQEYPGSVINYLDAGFPLFNGYPLFPHLSHNDGKKLDLAFFYLSPDTYLPLNDAPSPTGYGICEEPRPGEQDMPASCSKKNWQYDLMKKLVPQSARNGFVFDSVRTKTLLGLLMAEPEIEKVFIEPHLKTRLGLTGSKIRFHGCNAVRHDDHIHIQMK